MMNINFKPAQFELFPNAVNSPDETRRPHFMAARFNLSIENLVIFSIVSIMVVIFTFSLGVERGKGIALRDPAGSVSDGNGMLKPADPVKPAPASAALKPMVADKVPATVQPNKTVAAAGPEVAAARVSAGGWTLQLASYKTEKGAQKAAQPLLKKGFKAFVLPRGQHVILCVGNFPKKEDASMYGRKLKSDYKDFLVRRL